MIRNTYRYERKFLIENGNQENNIQIILRNPGLFSEIYPEREINNIYLDTEEYDFFKENINGIAKRKKIRIRWYDKKSGYIEPILEIKEKSGLVGTKYSFNLATIHINDITNKEKLIELFHQSNLPESIAHELNSLNLTLMNTYNRKYYLSSNNKIRLTLDSNIEYFIIRNINNINLYSFKTEYNIIELKYEPNDDLAASIISNNLPWRMTRSSKYVDGVKLINLFN